MDTLGDDFFVKLASAMYFQWEAVGGDMTYMHWRPSASYNDNIFFEMFDMGAWEQYYGEIGAFPQTNITLYDSSGVTTLSDPYTGHGSDPIGAYTPTSQWSWHGSNVHNMGEAQGFDWTIANFEFYNDSEVVPMGEGIEEPDGTFVVEGKTAKQLGYNTALGGEEIYTPNPPSSNTRYKINFSDPNNYFHPEGTGYSNLAHIEISLRDGVSEDDIDAETQYTISGTGGQTMTQRDQYDFLMTWFHNSVFKIGWLTSWDFLEVVTLYLYETEIQWITYPRKLLGSGGNLENSLGFKFVDSYTVEDENGNIHTRISAGNTHLGLCDFVDIKISVKDQYWLCNPGNIDYEPENCG